MKSSLFLPLFIVSISAAEAPPVDLDRPEFANCSWYRSKRNDVPVYAEAETTAVVIDKAARGEKLCGIGEQAEFAVLEWGKQPLLRGAKKEGEPRRAYARLADLWEPRQEKKKDESLLGGLRIRPGRNPDDPIWFLRPFLDPFFSRDPCRDPTRIGCSPVDKSKKQR